MPAGRHHGHIHSGINGHFDGFFVRGGNSVALIQAGDIGPIGYDHAVPVQLFFGPLGKQYGIGHPVHPVDGGGIGHHGERSGAQCFQEGGKLLFSQVLVVDNGWGTVQSVDRNTVAHIMLKAGSYVIVANIIKILSLQAFHHFTPDCSSQVTILPVAFPLAWPCWLTSHIHYRTECPWDPGRACFIGGDFPCPAGQFLVEGGCHVYALRKQGAIGHVGGPMDLVQAVKARNPYGFQGFVLNNFYEPVPFFRGLGRCEGGVQDGSHFISDKHRVHFGRIKLKVL